FAAPDYFSLVEEGAKCYGRCGYLTEPVTIACAHNFCRVCITQHCEEWEKGTRPELTCPQCREPLQKGEFKPNTQLNNRVQKIKQLRIHPGKGKEPVVDLCGRHEELLKLFCEEDGEAICWVCEKSRDHRSHTVVPIEEAAQDYKERLQEALGPLRKELEQALVLTSKEEKKPSEWQVGVEKRAVITGEFNRLHTWLKEEEQGLLQRLAEEERETLQRLQENVTKLSQQSSSLQQLIAELEKKCQQRAAELLKVRDRRSWSVKLQEPGAISTELKNVYKICLAMKEMLQRFWVDMTLDPDTANGWLVLSEDRKSRFDTYPEVLGAERFTGGRCYWEVEVGDKTEWTLGVCRESVSKKGMHGKYKARTSPSTPLPVSDSPSRVGIFLDYEAGEVLFYNVTDGSHLFTFTDTFSGTLRPYFHTGLSAGDTNVAPLIICPIPAQARGNL
uniref:RING-type E3 ubiquitin transferase n=1 Tax=Pelusios castaneus TaxID=367368 RepID=A0A8C8VGE2_9SAUR